MKRPTATIKYGILACFFGVVVVSSAVAHTPVIATQPPPPTFQRTSTLALSFSQSAVSDWQQGDKSLIDIKFGMNNRFTFSFKPIVSVSTVRVLVGGQREYSDYFPQGIVRATDNEIFGESVFTLPLGLLADPYCSVNVRTQVTESRRLLKDKITRTAKLWDPVTSQQAMGVALQNVIGNNRLTTRLGITLQQIRADDHTELTDNFTTPIKEQYKADSGIEWISEAQQTLDTAVTYTGRIATRAVFLRLDRWTVLWENEFRFKIWKFIGATLTINLNYNPNQSATMQFRQAMSIGVLQDI